MTGHVDIIPIYQAGDPPPTGYNQWHAWAEVQYKAGLRQAPCTGCQRWFFPQEKHVCPANRTDTPLLAEAQP